MNILILSWRGPGHPLAGGAEQVTWRHALAWTKAGHSVTIFTSAYSSAPHYETRDGIHIYRYGWQFFGVQISACIWYLFRNHPHFDLVVDEFHGLPFFTPLYVRCQKLAFIHEVAQAVWALNPWPYPFNLIPAYLGKWGEPWIFKLFYRHLPFLTVSASTRRDLSRFGITDVTVIPNGVSLPDRLPSGPKDAVFTVCHLSALTRDKGVEDSLRAFAVFHHRFPSSRLWVIGKGQPDYVSRLTQLAGRLNLANVTVFWGYVTTEQKFSLLRRAGLLINPSVHEGWGLVNIEANSVGTPVVGYPVAGTTDSVKPHISGLISSAATPDSLAENMLQLALNKHMYRNLSASCREWARRFTWAKSTTASLSLIQRLIQHG